MTQTDGYSVRISGTNGAAEVELTRSVPAVRRAVRSALARLEEAHGELLAWRREALDRLDAVEFADGSPEFERTGHALRILADAQRQLGIIADLLPLIPDTAPVSPYSSSPWMTVRRALTAAENYVETARLIAAS